MSVFCWAWPRSLCCFAALETKRKSGWGICGSSLSVFFLVLCDDLPFYLYRPIELCTLFFTAYVVIRTVPQSIYGHTREKKKAVGAPAVSTRQSTPVVGAPVVVLQWVVLLEPLEALDPPVQEIAIARHWIHQFRGIAITRNGASHNSSATPGVANVSLWRSLRNSRMGQDHSPSDPNTVPACGHRYQRCGDGGTEDCHRRHIVRTTH